MGSVLLYSGGMDSYIIRKLLKPDKCLYIDFGIEQNTYERALLPDDVEVVELPLKQFMSDDGNNVILLRNLIFAAIAVNYGTDILLGGVADDIHYDSAIEFVEKETELFNSFLENEGLPPVRVRAPFKLFTKEELLKKYVEAGYDVDDLLKYSWSCYSPHDGKECGKCTACRRKLSAIENVKKYMGGDKL